MVKQRGYSLLEVVVMMSVFGAVLAIFFTLTAEMRNWEKRLPVNYMKHPQVAAVMARLRRDVLDAHVPSGPYVSEFQGYRNDEQALVFNTILPNGTIQTVVWDFRERGVVYRHAYTSEMRTATWTARGVPEAFSENVGITAAEFEDRPYGVRIRATDQNGRITIDQILQPRAYK